MGSDGKRHWVTYKYERLPFFCYYCGVLGHDIRHCSAHFEASKKDTPVEYQYRDWLKADNGKSKSPPHRGKDSPMRSKPTGRTDVTATESDERLEAMTAAARVPDYRARRKIQNRNHEVGGNGLEIQKKISEVNATQISNVDELMPKLTPGGDMHPNLNDESKVGSNTTNSSLGHMELKPNKPKLTWIRLNRMDVGPIETTSIIMKSMMGERGLEDVLTAECNRDTEPTSHKCSKVVMEDGIIENISVGVDDHPYQE